MLMIFGANGPSGRQLIQQLSPLERETAVAALRLPEQQADEFFADHHIRTTVADTLDAEAVAQAVQQYRPDTVVSFVGGKNEQGIRSDATVAGLDDFVTPVAGGRGFAFGVYGGEFFHDTFALHRAFRFGGSGSDDGN